MNSTNVIFVFFLLCMIEKSISLYCNMTFNVSDPSTYWAYDASYTLCPFCPQVNYNNEFCPTTPGQPIDCHHCVVDYCHINNDGAIDDFCGS